MTEKITLDRMVGYRIEVQGHLAHHWGESLGMKIAVERDCPPVSSLTGELDQAGLHGVLCKLYAIGLPLILVLCTQATPAASNS
jgi:hypothetical protein